MTVLRAQNQAAFTLIEMMVSVALMSLILGAGYMCLSAGVDSKKLIEARSDGVQTARVALSLMAADLRAAVPMPGNAEFLALHRTMNGADADNIDFCTRNYKPHGSREPDYCEVSYFLEADPESDSFILRRRRDPTPDPEPLTGGHIEEIARGVTGLTIEYYDGLDWWVDWGDPEGKTKGMTYPPLNSYGMPEAVRITLTFDPEARKRGKENSDDEQEEKKAPMTFSTVARIELTPFFSRQTKSNNSGQTQEQPQPAQEAEAQ